MIDVKDDGSCFFRAIYGFAMHYGFLEELFKCVYCHDLPDKEARSYIESKYDKYGVETKKLKQRDEEDKWVRCVRNFLSYQILHDEYCRNMLKNTYRYWKSLEQEVYELLLENSIPRWIKEIYPNVESLKQTTIEEFIQVIAYGVKGIRNWASQLEFDMLNYLMKKCNIKIHVISKEDAIKNAVKYKNQIITIDDIEPPILSHTTNRITDTEPQMIARSSNRITDTGPQMVARNVSNTHNSGLLVGGSVNYNIFICNLGDAHYNFITWKRSTTGGKNGGGGKIFIQGKIRRKYYDKNKKRYYVKINKTIKYLPNHRPKHRK